MAGTLEGCLTLAKRSVADALKLDSEHKSKEAYCHYLACMIYISNTLKEDAWDKELQNCNTVETAKLFILMQQCLERSMTLLKEQGQQTNVQLQAPQQQSYNFNVPPQATQTYPQQSFPSQPTNQIQRHQTWSPAKQNNRSNTRMSASLPSNLQQYNLPSPPGSPKVNRRGNFQPLEHAHQANQQVLTAYRQRMCRSHFNNQQMTSKNLSMMRKISENLSIAKAHEDAISKRRHHNLKRLQQEVERRFTSQSSSSSEENKLLYVKVLEFEQESKWPREALSQKLKASPDDSAIINYAITMILRSDGHPLTQLLTQYQYGVWRDINSLLQEPSPGEVHPGQIYTDTRQNLQDTHSQNIPTNESSESSKYDQERFVEPVDTNTLEIGHRLNDAESSEATKEVNESVVIPQAIITVNEEDFDDLDDVYEFLEESDSEESACGNDDDNDKTSNEENSQSKTDEEVDQTGKETDDGSVKENKSLDASTEITIKEGSSLSELKEEGQETVDESGDRVGVKEHVGSNENITENVDSVEEKAQQVKEHMLDDNVNSHDDDNPNDNENPSDDENPNDDDNDDDNCSNDSSNDSVSMKKHGIDSNESEKRTEIKDMIKSPKKTYSVPDMSEAVKIQNVLKRKMKKITADIRFYIDKLQMLLTLVYEELDTPAGRDQCYASIELAFFTKLWPSLLCLFKRVNYSSEVVLAHVMTNHIRDSPQDMDVVERLCLTDQEFSGNDYPYKMAVDELYKVMSYVCPLEKLECIVRTSRAICQCVEDFCEKKGLGKHSSLAAMGCDDLLPILGYVVVKCGISQIVSECNAMEEFIPDGYLMGEEGYCLTTLQTVLAYLASLDTNIEQ